MKHLARIVCATVALLGAVAARADNVVLTFEDLTNGTVVQHQYDSNGVYFVNDGSIPFPVIDTLVSCHPPFGCSSNNVANFGECGTCGEFYTPWAKGVFTTNRQHVALNVGYEGSPLLCNDTAQITLQAFNPTNKLVASAGPVTVTCGQSFLLLQVDSATNDIAWFQVFGRSSVDANKPLVFDNLTFDLPPVPPPPDFSLAAPVSITVLQGGSATGTITIRRLNGSTGNINFTATGLPDGVSASFAPNPANGTQTLLTLTASNLAVPNGANGRSITVTGSPDAGAGTMNRSSTLLVFIHANFSVSAENNATVTAGACAGGQIPIDVTRDSSFSGTVSLGISGLPANVQASFNPPAVDFHDGGLVNTSVLSFSPGPLASFQTAWVWVHAASGNLPALQTEVELIWTNGWIASFSPPNGNAPQTLQPGTLVTMQGNGFCPGSTVQFGNFLAASTPSFVSADGTQLQARVPRLATDGPLVVIKPDGTELVAPVSFAVRCFRNQFGYSFVNSTDFQNAVGGYNFDNVQELFGFGQTHVYIPFPVPDPFALLFTAIADKTLQGGQCQGFSLSSQRFMNGDAQLANFPQQMGATSPTVWNLQGPESAGGPSASLSHYIHIQHLVQFSAEYLKHFVAKSSWNLSQASSASIYNDFATAFNAGQHPLIAIRNGTDGHVLVAYDLEPGAGPHDYFIDVYDPNTPFVAGENSLDGQAHKANEQNSRIHVTANNQWSFQGAFDSVWGGGFEKLVQMNYGEIPLSPTLPSSLFGLAAFVLSDAAQTTQVADDAGHTFFQPDGSANTNFATGLPLAAQFAPLAGVGGSGGEIFLVATNGNYTHSVRGAGNGAYSATIFGYQCVSRLLDVPTTPTEHDMVQWTAGLPLIGFSTDAAAKPVTMQVMVRAAGGFVRSATLAAATLAGNRDALGFDAAAQSLTYRHSGPATTFTLTLAQTEGQGGPAAFSSTPLTVDANGTVNFTPADWANLNNAPVTEVYSNSSGQQVQVTISNAAPAEPAVMFQFSAPISSVYGPGADQILSLISTGMVCTGTVWYNLQAASADTIPSPNEGAYALAGTGMRISLKVGTNVITSTDSSSCEIGVGYQSGSPIGDGLSYNAVGALLNGGPFPGGTDSQYLYVELRSTNLNALVSDALPTQAPQLDAFGGSWGGYRDMNFYTYKNGQFYYGVWGGLVSITVLPVLSSQVLGGQIVLSWPSAAAGFQLEATQTPELPGSWSAVAPTPMNLNGAFQIQTSLPTDGARRFFRLRGP